MPLGSTSFAALLTPAGRGAVAVVQAWGDGATTAVSRCFRPVSLHSVADLPINRLAFGRWRDDAATNGDSDVAGEELIVRRRTDDEWEIHGHGGTVAVAAVLRSLERGGCAVVSWREAMASQHDDPSVVEAYTALAAASTMRTASIALDQTAGAFTHVMNEIVRLLQAGSLDEARRRRDRVLDLAPAGRFVSRPANVVLVGRPNVGKSSLLNALVGYRRAIVFDAPGTTRDVVGAATVFDGWPIELFDTAGLRDPGDSLEAAGIDRTLRRTADADLTLLVCDSSVAWSDEDRRLAAEHPRALVVHNKADLCSPPSDRPTGCVVSAGAGFGLDELMAMIVERLIPVRPQPGEAVPLNERQVAKIHELSDHGSNESPLP